MNFRNLAMWAVIIVLTIGLYNMFKNPQGSESQKNNIIFSEFLTSVENGEVLKVEIQGNNIKGVYSDGKSFTTRTVNAIQNGEYIFNMSVSFKISEEGFEHQFEMPDVPGPENLKSDREFREEMKDSIPKEMLEGFLRDKPIEIRNVENLNPFANEKGEPFKNMWIKASGKLPDNHLIHQGCKLCPLSFQLQYFYLLNLKLLLCRQSYIRNNGLQHLL